MRARVLPSDEWGRIGAPLLELFQYVEPGHANVVVVEDENGIAASVGVLQVTHFEGLWIRPDRRGNAGVFRALIREAYAIPRARGERFAFGGAELNSARMDELCMRLGGQPLPVKFYALAIGDH